ncbi:MAG: GNAT family N-acetyltransferase [Pseudomonadota bacterium]
MTDVPRLETERLVLRGHRFSDFEPMAQHWESPRTRHIGGPLDRREAWRDFSTDCAQWTLRGFGMWILEETSSGETAGWVGFFYPDHYKEPELGWILFEAFEGRGLAYEAALAAREYGSAQWDIKQPPSFIDIDNHRSVALAKRLGATLESTQEKDRGSYFVYRHPAPGGRP